MRLSLSQEVVEFESSQDKRKKFEIDSNSHKRLRLKVEVPGERLKVEVPDVGLHQLSNSNRTTLNHTVKNINFTLIFLSSVCPGREALGLVRMSRITGS